MSVPIVAQHSDPCTTALNPTAMTGNGQYLIFRIGESDYAVPALQVREIRRRSPITGIPSEHTALLGVIDLRGTVLPVLELRTLLGIESSASDSSSVMLVLDVGGKWAGFVVDSVSDVSTLSDDALRPVPDLLPGSREGVAAVTTVEDRIVLLLDPAGLPGLCTTAALPQAA